jgi:hypothetical protein
MPRRHLRLMRACVRMGCGGPCSAPLPDLKTLHQSRSLRNAATTATGRLRAGGPLFAAHPRRQGRRMGEEKRRSSVRRKEPFAPLSSSAAPPVSRSGGRFSTRAGGTGSDAFGKSALHQLFLLSVFEKRPRCGSRWFVGGSVLPGAGHSGAVFLHFWESRSARVGRHVLRGGFASGTSRRRELGAHGAG